MNGFYGVVFSSLVYFNENFLRTYAFFSFIAMTDIALKHGLYL